MVLRMLYSVFVFYANVSTYVRWGNASLPMDSRVPSISKSKMLVGRKLQNMASHTLATQLHTAKMEMLDAQPYLAGVPPDCLDSADVLLLLKDNKCVRVHSALLACHSTVLSTLLSHLTSKDGDGKRPFEVPFQEFSGKEALDLLKVLYAKRFALTSIESAHTAARYGHKYDAIFIRQIADEYLSAQAFPSNQARVRLHLFHRPALYNHVR